VEVEKWIVCLSKKDNRRKASYGIRLAYNRRPDIFKAEDLNHSCCRCILRNLPCVPRTTILDVQLSSLSVFGAPTQYATHPSILLSRVISGLGPMKPRARPGYLTNQFHFLGRRDFRSTVLIAVILPMTWDLPNPPPDGEQTTPMIHNLSDHRPLHCNSGGGLT
jgi:hypothetical protein